LVDPAIDALLLSSLPSLFVYSTFFLTRPILIESDSSSLCHESGVFFFSFTIPLLSVSLSFAWFYGHPRLNACNTCMGTSFLTSTAATAPCSAPLFPVLRKENLSSRFFHPSNSLLNELCARLSLAPFLPPFHKSIFSFHRHEFREGQSWRNLRKLLHLFRNSLCRFLSPSTGHFAPDLRSVATLPVPPLRDLENLPASSQVIALLYGPSGYV